MNSLLDTIKKESENQLVVVPVGVGSAFSKLHSQTSLIVAKNGVTILVDCGATIPTALACKGIKMFDFDYYYFTHSHADHIGGIEELFLLSRYVLKKKPKVIITPDYQRILWEHSLKGGCEYNESGLLRFSDLAEPVRPTWVKSQPREVWEISVGGINLSLFRTKHIPGDVAMWEQAFWSTGIVVDNRFLYTGDTRFDIDLFSDMKSTVYDMTIFHDCQLFSPGTVHATYDELNNLAGSHHKRKMYLIHYGDNFLSFSPKKDGFVGFAQEWEFYKI